MSIGHLHVLTDFVFQQRFSHAELAARAITGGADTIQFRQKTGPIRAQLYEAERTAIVCREANLPLLIDDDLALAQSVGAAGVHLGQGDLPVDVARRVLGTEVVIGATVTNVAQAQAAETAGASYLGFGPVFPTRSKRSLASVKGLDGLRAVCEVVSIPVIGIAGMTPERVASVLGAGAHGIAVMTAITTDDDPEAATAAFRKAIDSALSV